MPPTDAPTVVDEVFFQWYGMMCYWIYIVPSLAKTLFHTAEYIDILKGIDNYSRKIQNIKIEAKRYYRKGSETREVVRSKYKI